MHLSAGVIATAVRSLPHSVRIWLKAADIEVDAKDKKKVRLFRNSFPKNLVYSLPSIRFCAKWEKDVWECDAGKMMESPT